MSGYRLLEASDPELRTGVGVDVARAQLEATVVHDPTAMAFRAHVLAACDTIAQVLDRTARPGHLTASALVVDASAGRTLVLLHRKLGRWLQPGGHVDGDGNLAAAALREATEETGIAGLRVVVPAVDVDVHRVEPPGESAHDHLDVRFVVVAPPEARFVGNHESLGLRWVTESDLGELGADGGLLRLARVGFDAASALLR